MGWVAVCQWGDQERVSSPMEWHSEAREWLLEEVDQLLMLVEAGWLRGGEDLQEELTAIYRSLHKPGRDEEAAARVGPVQVRISVA